MTENNNDNTEKLRKAFEEIQKEIKNNDREAKLNSIIKSSLWLLELYSKEISIIRKIRNLESEKILEILKHTREVIELNKELFEELKKREIKIQTPKTPTWLNASLLIFFGGIFIPSLISMVVLLRK